MDDQLTAIDASRDETHDNTAFFDSLSIRAEFNAYMQSVPPTPPLSHHGHILRTVNLHLRELESSDDIVETAVGTSIVNHGDCYPFLNSALQHPYFSRCCDHRYSAVGLLM